MSEGTKRGACPGGPARDAGSEPVWTGEAGKKSPAAGSAQSGGAAGGVRRRALGASDAGISGDAGIRQRDVSRREGRRPRAGQPVENGLSVVQEEQAVYDFTGKKVLLAEDTAFNEEVATELLAMVHMDVDCAHNGKEAVELFEKAKPGTYMAILMDIHMPVMNGYEAARTIRKSEREDAGTIAIYAMTANSFEEDVSAALNAGMNGHIAKPIDAQILYEVLDKLAKEQQ